MTDLQLYLLIAPFVLLFVVGIAAWAGYRWIAWADNAQRRAR